jgi:glycosyltransferase involved in cell wall biosynthesis
MVMFSNYENMPVVISEAFACGLPVLTTNVGGIPEHVTPERGRMVSPRDEDAMLEKLNYILDNYRSFDREAIRKYAIEQYSTEAVARQIEKIYSFATRKQAAKTHAHKP